MPFTFTDTKIPEVKIIEPKYFGDDRGAFAELFRYEDFKRAGIDFVVKQVNYSLSEKGVLRGLHYQMNPGAQGKIISVTRGEIYDAAVDLRKKSDTYGQWMSVTLSEKNHRLVYVPAGFAHGFWVVSDTAQIIYYSNAEYQPDLERTIRWNDPRIKIDWPGRNPKLSDKDKDGVLLNGAENNY